MTELLVSWVLGFLAEFLRGAIADWRRDQALKEAGRHEAIDEARQEFDDAISRAKAAEDAWSRLDPDERERMREQRGHYRD